MATARIFSFFLIYLYGVLQYFVDFEGTTAEAREIPLLASSLRLASERLHATVHRRLVPALRLLDDALVVADSHSWPMNLPALLLKDSSQNSPSYLLYTIPRPVIL